MQNYRPSSILSQSLLISFVVLGGIYALILDAQTIFFLIYSCLLFGIDVWVWSRYFIKSKIENNSKSHGDESLKNILKPESKNSIFKNGSVSLLTAVFVLVTINLFFFKLIPVHAAATPTVALGLPSEVMIGENFSFSATFSNTGSSTGYGPYIDLVFPVTGIDGAGAAVDDGIDFTSATYLGTSVVATQLTFPATGTGCSGGQTPVTHPYAVNSSNVKQIVCGTPGDKLVVLQLPFGSFVTSQPSVGVTVNATLSNLADAGTPLTIQSRAGFRYGNDSLYNPATDPTIFGTFGSSNTTPTILKLSKTYIGPESETATGPNFPRQYRVSVDIANGQTVTNLDLKDFLPNNIAFTQIISKSPASGTATITPTVGVPQNSPNNQINVRFPSVTGGSGTNDANFVFEYYVTDQNANAVDVINHTTGDDATSTDDAKTSGNWTPIDGRDTAAVVSSDATLNDHTLNDKSIAIQKSVANISSAVNKPGDTLEYTLNTQISDYFAFENVVVTDVFSDGQLINNSFTPTLNWTVHGTNTSLAFNAANYTVVRDSPGTGNTTVTFRISDELNSRGLDPKILGGCVPNGGGVVDCSAYNGGATQGTIKLQTVIQQTFTDTFPSGESNVDMGDILTNNVTANGDVLNNATLVATGQPEADTSSASVSIGNATLAKTIYAVNGSTSFSSPVRLAPGDTVTYRLVYDIGVSDVENLYLIDYLPLPAFLASTVSGPFSAVVNASVPAAGTAKFGPTDTYYGISNIVPTMSIDNAANSVKFDFGNHADPLDRSGKVDLLFTVAMQDQPFADGMFLTNQARSHFGTTNSVDQTADSIVQVEINLPNLTITKGVVATDNPAATLNPTTAAPVTFTAPGGSCSRFSGTANSTNLGSTPISSAVTGVDAGDKVTFAVVLQNSGQNSGGGFDVKLKDDLPAGYAIPGGGANLCVTNGAGTSLSYSAINGGDSSPFFGSGISLANPSPTQGGIGTFNANTGSNIVVVTYDLVLDGTVQPSQLITNTATILNYSGVSGGVNYTTAADFATQTTTIGVPSVAKSLVSTNQAFTTTNNVAIGEQVQFNAQLTIKEGTMNQSTLVDTLDPGLAFVSIDSITPSSGAVTTSIVGGFPQVLTNAAFSNLAPLPNQAGRVLTLDFGTLTNTDTTNTTVETIDVKYTAVVVNTSDAVRGGNKKNNAVLNWNNGTAQNVTTTGATVHIQEPSMKVVKTANPATGDAADTVTFTMVVSQNSIADTTNAYEVTLNDPLPAKLTYVPGSVINTAGLAPDSLTFAAGSIQASWATFTPANTSTITLQATIDNTVTPKEVLTNTATVKYSSLPGAVASTQSTHHTLATERTGNTSDLGGSANNYTTTGSATETILGTAPVKSIVSTSEAHTSLVTGTERVAIGEIVRYRLVTLIPEGSLGPSTILRDQVPNGMSYINDGTAKIAFVSNGSGVTSTNVNTGQSGCGSLVVSGNSGTQIPSCTIDSSLISPVSFANGTDVNFALGTITNNDNDADNEYMVVELNLLVGNVVGNQSNTTLANNFQIFVNGSGTALDTSNNINVIVTEPTMTVTKTVAVTPVDAGDSITYNITYRNNSTGNNAAPAFDLVASDNLNTNLTLTSATVTSKPAYTTATENTSGNNVSFTLDKINAGDQVVIQVIATLNAATPVGFTIPNTANVTFTTLPGLNGTTPNVTGSVNSGISGSVFGERNGSGAPLNDYTVNGTASTILSAAPTIDKLNPTPTSYTIGESPSYDIKISLPEGITQGLQVVDTFPAGLTYTSYEVITSAALSNGILSADFAGTPTNTPTVTNVGNVYTFTFGNTATTNDNVATNNSFVLRVHTKVADVVGNVAGTVLTNNASLKYSNPTSGTQTINDATPPSITLLEPRLTLSKSVNPTSAAPGDTVTFTLNLSNTGTSSAYEVQLSDMIDASKFSNVTELSTPGDFTYNFASNTITYNAASLAIGQSRTFTFTAKVVAGLPNAQVITNTAKIDQYSSLSGTIVGERSYGPISAPANLTVATPDLKITKNDSVTAAIPGQILIYDLKVDNIGTYRADNVVISETIPSYSTFNAGNSSAGWVCVGTSCTFNIASINAGASTMVQFALVLDSFVPSGVSNFTNTASVAEDGSHGPDPTPANNTASDTDTLNFNPDLKLTKSDGDITAGVDQVVVYALNFTNVGSKNSTDVVITEQVPQYSTYNAASSTPGWTCVVSTCTFNVGNLNVNQTGSVNFAVKIDATLPAGVVSTTNNATITDDGNNGADITPADNNATDNTPLFALPDLKITKTDGQTTVNTNQDVVYTLKIENVGVQGATGVTVTDVVPANMSFVSADNGGSLSTGTVTWSGISLNAGQSMDLHVTLHTSSSVATGITQITNTADISDDGTNGVDPDTGNNSSTDTDTLNAIPELEVTITDHGVSAIPAQPLTYDINYKNNGDQEATGVILTAIIPQYTTYNSGLNTTAWVCPDNNPGTICNYTLPTSLISGATGSVSFVVSVDPTIPSGVTQTQTTTTIADDGTNGTDPILTNNHADEITPISALPDLTLTKSDGGVSAAIPGQDLTYTLNYANVGNKGTTGVVLYETVPIDATFNPTGSTAGWTCAPDNNAGSACTLAIGALNSAATGSAIFVIKPNVPWPVGVTQISNTAHIDDDDANGADPNPQNGHDAEASINTPVTAAPVIEAKKADSIAVDVNSNNIVDPGDTIKYTITLKNTGTQNAILPKFTDTPDAQTTLVVGSVNTSAGTVTTGNTAGDTTIAIDLGATLNAGDTVTISFNVLVPASLSGNISISNQGLFKSSNTTDTPTDDPDTSTSDDPTLTFVVGEHDLSVTKTDGVTTAQPGDTLTYTLNVTNNGNVTVNNITLTDNLPPVVDVTFISADNGGLLNIITNQIEWPTFSLGSNVSVARTVVLQVKNPLNAGVGSITNTANVSDDGTSGPDLNLANNIATDTDTIGGAASGPDLLITKTDGLTTAVVMQNLSYDVVVTNVGTIGATGVVATDVFPTATLDFVSADNGGTYALGIITWNIGNLSVGQSKTLHVVGKVKDFGVIQNIVNVTDDGTNGPDLNVGNNTAFDLTNNDAPKGPGTKILFPQNAEPKPKPAEEKPKDKPKEVPKETSKEQPKQPEPPKVELPDYIYSNDSIYDSFDLWTICNLDPKLKPKVIPEEKATFPVEAKISITAKQDWVRDQVGINQLSRFEDNLPEGKQTKDAIFAADLSVPDEVKNLDPLTLNVEFYLKPENAKLYEKYKLYGQKDGKWTEIKVETMDIKDVPIGKLGFKAKDAVVYTRVAIFGQDDSASKANACLTNFDLTAGSRSLVRTGGQSDDHTRLWYVAFLILVIPNAIYILNNPRCRRVY